MHGLAGDSAGVWAAYSRVQEDGLKANTRVSTALVEALVYAGA